MSIAYIYKAVIRRWLTGDAGINPHRWHALRKLSGAQELALEAHIRSRPGITLAQAQAWLLAEYGVELSTGAIWNARPGGSDCRSKKPCEPPSRTGRTWRQGASCARAAAIPRS